MADKTFNFFETWFMCMLLIFVGLAIGQAIDVKNLIISGGISAMIAMFATFID